MDASRTVRDSSGLDQTCKVQRPRSRIPSRALSRFYTAPSLLKRVGSGEGESATSFRIADSRTYESDLAITQTLQRLSGRRTARIRPFALNRQVRSQLDAIQKRRERVVDLAKLGVTHFVDR